MSATINPVFRQAVVPEQTRRHLTTPPPRLAQSSSAPSQGQEGWVQEELHFDRHSPSTQSLPASQVQVRSRQVGLHARYSQSPLTQPFPASGHSQSAVVHSGPQTFLHCPPVSFPTHCWSAGHPHFFPQASSSLQDLLVQSRVQQRAEAAQERSPAPSPR